jgi:hypothetical protein
MKISTATALAAILLIITSISADAATSRGKGTVSPKREAWCRAQAAKKYPAFLFLSRESYVGRCTGLTRTKWPS